MPLDASLASIPGLAGFLAKKQMNEQAPMQDMQQATQALSLSSLLGQKKDEAQIKAVIESGAPPEKVVTALLAMGPKGAAAAHQDASAMLDMQAAKASESLRNLTPAQLQDPDTLERLGASGLPNTAHFTAVGDRIRKKREEEATLKAMQSGAQAIPPDPQEIAQAADQGTPTPLPAEVKRGGMFDDLAKSEIPHIAAQAKAMQSQVDRSGSTIPPAYWQKQHDALAAREGQYLQAKAIADAKKNAPETPTGLSQQYGSDATYKKNVDYWAKFLKDGGTLPPRFAQSGAGKKMMPDILNVVPTLGDSKEMLAAQVDLTGQKSEARAVGARSAAVEMAAGEAREMMPILLTTSENFKRTGYQPINQVFKNFQDKTGNVESRQFGAALNSFVNVYARAVSPSGVPTVSDKDHAREVLSTADSHEQLVGLLKVLDQEMTAAQNAPRRVRDAQRAGITGVPAPSHGPTPTSPANPAVDALLKKYGG